MTPCRPVSYLVVWKAHKANYASVDAHVGKALFTDAIVGALRNQGKTVILVTHALHFLSQCDYVYSLENGYIAAQGKHQDLINENESFARLIAEFGGAEKHEEEEEDDERAVGGLSS